MHPNDTAPGDDPWSWKPQEPSTRAGQCAPVTPASNVAAKAAARLEQLESEGAKKPLDPRGAESATTRNSAWLQAPVVEGASSALGVALNFPQRSVVNVGIDWMGAEDSDLEPTATDNVRVAAPHAAVEAASATPAAPVGKIKRAYGLSRRPAHGANVAPTLMPLALEPDMFPAFMSRSALFSAIRANSGGYHNGPLKASGKVSLNFHGPRLSMVDKRVWEALVRAAKGGRFDLAGPCFVEVADVAEMAGFERGQTRSVWAAMERLAASKVDAMVEGVSVSGRLLASVAKIGKRRMVAFDPALMEAALGRALNAELAGSPRGRSAPLLAQWLGDYFLTHEPSTIAPDLNYLRELCGHAGSPKGFVAALEAAMRSLSSARPDLVAGWTIDKSRRSSLSWTLRVERGAARPRVKQFGKAVASAPADLKAAQARARRRGPAL